MARRKRRSRSRRVSNFRSSGFRTKRRRKTSTGGMLATVAGGFSYGAGRQYLSNWLTPFTARVPFGRYADNLVLGTVSWLAALGKIPFLNQLPFSRKVGMAGLMMESAFVGMDVTSGLMSNTNNNNSGNGSGLF